MIDPNFLLRNWLLTPSLVIDGVDTLNPVLAALDNEDNVFAGRLPENFNPGFLNDGLAIVVRVGGSGTTTGGIAHAEIPIFDPRMQITVWAGLNEFQLARSVDGPIFDWIHGKTNIDLGNAGYVMTCLNQVLGQDIQDPKTALATVVSFYHLKLRDNAA